MYRSLPRIQWSSTVKRSSFRSKRVWRRVERGGKKREGGEARDLRTPRLPANGRNGARLALALTLAGETLHSHWLRSLARSLARGSRALRLPRRPCASPRPATLSLHSPIFDPRFRRRARLSIVPSPLVPSRALALSLSLRCVTQSYDDARDI